MDLLKLEQSFLFLVSDRVIFRALQAFIVGLSFFCFYKNFLHIVTVG